MGILPTLYGCTARPFPPRIGAAFHHLSVVRAPRISDYPKFSAILADESLGRCSLALETIARIRRTSHTTLPGIPNILTFMRDTVTQERSRRQLVDLIETAEAVHAALSRDIVRRKPAGMQMQLLVDQRDRVAAKIARFRAELLALDAAGAGTGTGTGPTSTVGRIVTPDNRDARWSVFDNAAIERKVDEVMATHPRLEVETGGAALSQEERRAMLVGTFREIVKATSLDNLLCAPPELLEQYAVLALLKNENVKGLLVSLIRSFMMAYAHPLTSQSATIALEGIEKLGREAVMALLDPRKFAWKPLPTLSPAARDTDNRYAAEPGAAPTE